MYVHMREHVYVRVLLCVYVRALCVYICLHSRACVCVRVCIPKRVYS